MKSWRILHTESSINMGGQELRILEQIQWLNDNGHHGWLAARPDSKILLEAEARNIPCHAVNFRGSLNPSAMLGLTRLCRSLAVDLVDCHSDRDAAAAAAAKCLGVPVVRTLHMDKRMKRDFSHRLLWKRGNDGAIAASDSIRNKVIALGVPDDRVITVGEGVDETEFHPGVDGSDIRKRHQIPKDAFLVVQVGMIRPDKGQTVLVRAWDSILEQVPTAWLIMVGGPTRPEYATRLGDEIARCHGKSRIVMPGFRKDIPAYMAASDLVVLASTGVEAQSRIVPQAFLMRRPVLASAVGGVPELVSHGINGWLFEPKNHQALAKGVVHLHADPALRERIASAGYESAQANLTRARMMQKTLNAYQLLADSART